MPTQQEHPSRVMSDTRPTSAPPIKKVNYQAAKVKYDDLLVNPTDSNSPSLPAYTPAVVNGPSLLAGVAPGLGAHDMSDPAYVAGLKNGSQATLAALKNRAAQPAPVDTTQPQVTAPVQPTPVQNLFAGTFAGKSPFASMLSGAIQSMSFPQSTLAGPTQGQSMLAGGPGALPQPSDQPTQPQASTVTQNYRAAQTQATQPQTQQPTPAQPPQQAQPQTTAQANPFPQQVSQAAQNGVQQTAQSMLNDPTSALQQQKSAQRQAMLQSFQKQLQDLSAPDSKLTDAQKFQQARGIRAKLAAFGAGVVGGIHVDPQALGAMAMTTGDRNAAYQQVAQADTENNQKQEQLTEQEKMRKAQIFKDNLNAWQTMNERDDSDDAANQARYRQEQKEAQDAIEHGASDKGEFTGSTPGGAEAAIEQQIRTGQLDPSAVHVYHVGDGKVRIVEALDHSVDADTANASLAASGSPIRIPAGASISKGELYSTTRQAQVDNAKATAELKKAQQESDIIQQREIAVNAAKEGQKNAKTEDQVNTLAANAAQGMGVTLDQLDPKTRASVSAQLSKTDPNLDQKSITMTTADRTKQQLALSDQHNLNVIQGIIARRPDLVGALAGREANGKWVVGTNDPDLSSLKVAYDNYALAAVGIHGSRSVLNKEQAEDVLSNKNKNGQQAVLSGIKTAYDSADVFAHPEPKSKDGSPYIVLPQGNGAVASPYEMNRAMRKTGGDQQSAMKYLVDQGYVPTATGPNGQRVYLRNGAWVNQ